MAFWFVKTNQLSFIGVGKQNFANDDIGITNPPMVYSGTIYGTPSNPYTGIRLAQSSPTSTARTAGWYAYVGTTNTSLAYLFRGQSSSSAYNVSRRMSGNLIRSNTEITNSGILAYGKKLTASNISGKYRPKSNLITTPITYGGVDVPVLYSFAGSTFDHMVFPAWSDGYSGVIYTATNSPSSNIFNALSDSTNKSSFAGYRTVDITAENFDYTWFTTAYNSQNISSGYQGQTLDFGDVPQEVPDFFISWINANFDPVYTNTYTIKNETGTQTVAQITEAPAMKKAVLLYVGTTASLTLTGVNDVEYPVSWTVEPPNGKTLVGLGTSQNRTDIPIGTTTISWAGQTLYESFKTYRPPATTFDINLYQNSAEVNRVDKTDYLTSIGTLSGVLREECSIIAPSITFKQTTVPNFNYVYIERFGRYYFVTGITSVSNDIWRMSLSCDVLMTWKDNIRAFTAIIARQENSFNPLLIDSELPAQVNQNVTVTEFPAGGFSTDSAISYPFILTVVGA